MYFLTLTTKILNFLPNQTKSKANYIIIIIIFWLRNLAFFFIILLKGIVVQQRIILLCFTASLSLNPTEQSETKISHQSSVMTELPKINP